jgi:S-adenosylmethionine hydrolase
MRNPIITLLTDFGTRDHYVPSMKGVILGINPRVTLVDISHEVRPHDIREAAFLIFHASSSFPKGTIHLAVVDPGVGGPRKPILLVTPSYFFVGPDNGLFTLTVQREGAKQVVALTKPEFFLAKVSSTFHGRDLFAPVAAHLSLGVKPRAFGDEIDSYEEIGFGRPRTGKKELKGEILHIDTFGNLISNIDERELAAFTRGRPSSIKVGKRTIRGLRKGYWAGKKGEVMALFGGTGFLEISVREGNAREVLKVEVGDQVKVEI